MRAANIITSAALMVLGGIVAWDSLRLGIGWGTDGPKSGFFPFWLAAVMIVACAGIVVQAVGRAGSKPFVTRKAFGSVLKVLWPAVAMVLLTQLIGLYAASALYLAFYMRWIGHHSWGAIVAVSVAFPVVMFFVFEIWFLVPMPKGPIESWLGY